MTCLISPVTRHDPPENSCARICPTAAVVVSVLVSSLPTTISRPAVAQTEDAATVHARQRFKEGVDYFDARRYEDARLAFLQAHALRKHPAVLLNIAESALRAGRALESARYYKQFSKESGGSSPEQRAQAEKGLSEARQRLGRIDVSAPAGAEVALDGETIGTAPLAEPVDVEPGPHTVTAGTESVKVIAVIGQKVEAKLSTPAAAPPVAAAVVPVMTTPAQAAAAESPSPTAERGAAGFTAPPAEPPRHASVFSPPASMGPVYLGLVVSGIGLGGTIVFAALRADAQSQADAVEDAIERAAAARGLSPTGICVSSDPVVRRDFSKACKTFDDNTKKADTHATLTNVSLAVMGIGLVTAAGWYLFGPKRAAQITPYAGASGGGFVVHSTF